MHRLDQLAALIDFGHDAVRLDAAIGADGTARAHSSGSRRCTVAVGEHIGAPVGAEPADDDAAGVGVRPARHRRVDRDHHAASSRRVRHACALDQLARPERVGTVLDQLAIELLPRRAACRR